MKRVCAIVCNNGLGHFRRTLQVVAGLLASNSRVSLRIVCAPWQLESLSRWQTLQSLLENPRVDFEFLETYTWWSSRREFHQKDSLLTWHEQLRPLILDSYDLVLSDNLVEPLIYQPRTLLMGSFLWHDIYAEHFVGDTAVRKYRDRCTSLLQEHRPPIIVNRYFAMPGVGEFARTIGVGMLPAVIKQNGRQLDEAIGILFIGGSSRRVAESMRSFLLDLLGAKLLPDSIRLWVDKPLARQLPLLDEVSVFDYDADDFSCIDAVVARPGLGVITDCIVAGVPIFCLHEPNFELDFNARTLEQLSLGRSLTSLQDCLEQIRAFFDDEHARERYRTCWTSIDKDGLEQTLKILTTYLN